MNPIGQWLEQLGLGRYTRAFVENDIDESILPELTNADLKELGVKSLGHRKILLKAIAALGSGTLPVPTPAPSSAEAEHRQLTVMFCDLVGSTELTQRIDPEDLRDINLAYQDACKEAVDRFEGYIARFLGDGILVYFGYPKAHEDDAERAVRAGLQVVASMESLNAELGARHDVQLQVRIGIATGAVVVGDLIGESASEEAAVVGETPNLAARLQGIAGPDEVVISQATRQLLGGMFEFDDLGDHELKGLATPVRAWRVAGERDVGSRYEARRVGSRWPLVGRQEELGLLMRSWDASREEHGQVVLVQGEAGIGKSRLLDALRDSVANEEHVWVTHWCSPYHADSTLYPVIEHLKRVVGWKPDDSPDEKFAKLESTLGSQSLPLEESVPLLSQLMSVPVPEGRYAPLDMSAAQQRDLLLDTLTAWLLDEAEHKPVINVWEDLHWADPTTLELIALYIEQSPTVSMLTVLTYRPEFVPPWSMHSHMTPITLNRMERSEVEALIGHQASNKLLPAEVVNHIVDKADGVPLFVEELTKAALDSEFLREEESRYTLTGALSELEIPATLQDSLMARLDRFPTLREVAQLGAVLGREFAYGMLESLTSLDESTLRDGLGQLVESELLYQRGRPPRSRYIFKHALIQDAAYQSLLRRTREEYHRKIANLMIEQFPDVVASQPELVAHHFEKGGCDEDAVEYFEIAGQQALGRSAYVEAAAHLEKALECLRHLPQSPDNLARELDLQMALGPTLVATRGFGHPDVGKAYARAWDLCREIADDVHMPIVLRGRQIFHLLRGELKQARDFAQQLRDHADRKKDTALKVGGCHAMCQTEFFAGHLEHARGIAEEGIEAFDASRHRLSTWAGGQPGEQCYLYGGFSLWMLGYPDQALRLAEEALRLARALPNPGNLLNTLAFVATLHVMRKDIERGIEKAEEAISLGNELRNPNFVGQASVLHGWLLIARDGAAEGLEEIDRGLTIFRSTGLVSWLPYLLGLKAESCCRLGEIAERESVVGEAIDLAETTGQAVWSSDLYRIKGDLFGEAHPGGATQAEQAYLTALDIARRQGARTWELRAATSLARTWQARGRERDARECLAPTYEWFAEGLDTTDLATARSVLEALG